MSANRIFAFLILFLFAISGNSQLTLLNSGTTTTLRDLSVIDGKIVICGDNNYLVRSNDEGKSLVSISLPSPPNYANRLYRKDTSIFYLMSYTPGQTLLYKTLNGGFNWIQIKDTTGSFNRDFGFFDSMRGIMSSGVGYMRTTSGGSTWVTGTSPFQVGISVLKIYGDSLVCMGGVDVNGTGVVLSKNRGLTWSSEWPLWSTVTDFFFHNKDTIFGVSYAGEFIKTTNGGQTWTYSNVNSISSANGVYFKNAKEGYVIGNDAQNNGVIIKTADLGSTWSIYNTGIKTSLMNIFALNDSIAILTGTGGVLLRWNYKTAIFTGLKDNSFNSLGIDIFPNPVTDKFQIKSTNGSPLNLYFTINNNLGQIVFEKEVQTNQEIDLSSLRSGVYYLKVKNEKGQKVFKFIKD